MIGVRDLSIIETPPKNRLAIQTAVMKFSRRIIESAIDLELKRQGQVFFLHNSVETIQSIAGMVQEIVPKARVAVAHGQMKESQLEAVMLAFLEYRYDVLICTTIIENGLDIPRANTLLVNRADRFGLAQLYQLRGRVGRSSRRAYAYLLIPSEETLSSDAQKRLAAIKDFSDLGSGFRIAALDLEIRGSGNLLGGEQHGHINAVGFELYVKLLDQSVQELKGKEPEEEIQTNIDLHFDIQIPEHYIDDPTPSQALRNPETGYAQGDDREQSYDAEGGRNGDRSQCRCPGLSLPGLHAQGVGNPQYGDVRSSLTPAGLFPERPPPHKQAKIYRGDSRLSNGLFPIDGDDSGS